MTDDELANAFDSIICGRLPTLLWSDLSEEDRLRLRLFAANVTVSLEELDKEIDE